MTSKKSVDYKVEVFTGVRPSGGLTIANAVSAIHPIVKLQKEGKIGRPMVAVVDLHALTDGEPSSTQEKVLDIVKDYIALGMDHKKSDIFIQSQLVGPISELNLYLSRLITIAELMRVPTLKEKIKTGQSENTANALLAMYPIMMASDILLQQSEYIPVGEDQIAHLEVARVLARKFNKKYGEVFAIPKILSLGEPIRIKSLNGNGKMSKSDPTGAIILDDPIETSLSKVKKAQTAFAGETSDTLDSLVIIGKYVANEKEEKLIDDIMKKHYAGENVMGDLKQIIMVALARFLEEFQSKKKSIKDEEILKKVQEDGKTALSNAEETVESVKKAMGFKYI